jgi:hypothetical protein
MEKIEARDLLYLSRGIMAGFPAYMTSAWILRGLHLNRGVGE